MSNAVQGDGGTEPGDEPMGGSSSATDPLVGLAMALQGAPGRFALLVGSGISYASGIPTGWAVVSDLARRIAVADGEAEPPADPVAWYAARFGGSPGYSDLLAHMAPTAAQRRDLLAGYFEPTENERERGLKAPTRAHRAIARLVERGTVRVIITTNFDRLLEQAIQAAGIEPVVVATAASAEGTIPLAHSRCTIIKVHGDYLDPNIKNTIGELEAYDPPVDVLLDRAFDDYGLVVCGWSATWDPALRNAIERCPTRRYGTYWAARGEPSEDAARLITNRSATIVPIEGADEFFEALLGKVEALDELSRRSAIGVDLVAAEAKRYLPDPVHRIRLHDLVVDATGRSLASIDFDGNQPPGSGSPYLAKAKDIERASSDLVAVVAVLGEFAKTEEQLTLLPRVLQRLAGPTESRLEGRTAWIKLRGYPALLAVYAAGLAATSSDNWVLVARMLATPTVDPARSGNGPLSFPERFASYRVLEAQGIGAAYGDENRLTPISDYLHDHLASLLRPQLRLSEEEFSQVFDEWEFLVNILAHDGHGHGPIGRFVWRNRFKFDDLWPDRALTGATDDLLAAGFFNGTAERLEQVGQEYATHVQQRRPV